MNSEWLCRNCRVIHMQQRDGFIQPCPDCGLAMVPTSPDMRRIDELEHTLISNNLRHQSENADLLNVIMRMLHLLNDAPVGVVTDGERVNKWLKEQRAISEEIYSLYNGPHHM